MDPITRRRALGAGNEVEDQTLDMGAGSRDGTHLRDSARRVLSTPGPIACDDMGSVTPEVYRHAMSHLGGGVCLVTCAANGLDHAMTATAVIAVSLTPPLLLVSVDRSSRFHLALEAADDLAVTFLAEHQVALARHFSRSGRDLVTQFDNVATQRLDNGCLVLPDALTGVGAHIESRLPGGDHTLVLAELTEVMAGSASDSAGPLVYFSSGFRPLSGDGRWD